MSFLSIPSGPPTHYDSPEHETVCQLILNRFTFDQKSPAWPEERIWLREKIYPRPPVKQNPYWYVKTLAELEKYKAHIDQLRKTWRPAINDGLKDKIWKKGGGARYALEKEGNEYIVVQHVEVDESENDEEEQQGGDQGAHDNAGSAVVASGVKGNEDEEEEEVVEEGDDDDGSEYQEENGEEDNTKEVNDKEQNDKQENDEEEIDKEQGEEQEEVEEDGSKDGEDSEHEQEDENELQEVEVVIPDDTIVVEVPRNTEPIRATQTHRSPHQPQGSRKRGRSLADEEEDGDDDYYRPGQNVQSNRSSLLSQSKRKRQKLSLDEEEEEQNAQPKPTTQRNKPSPLSQNSKKRRRTLLLDEEEEEEEEEHQPVFDDDDEDEMEEADPTSMGPSVQSNITLHPQPQHDSSGRRLSLGDKESWKKFQKKQKRDNLATWAWGSLL